jgi:hypothetical protein
MLDRCAYYAYAIARPRPEGRAGDQLIPGVDPRYRVREIAHGDVLALVSDVSLAEYDLESLRERFQDSLWLELLARGHQRVIEALSERYTLLPLKLCTLYTDEAHLHEALAANGAWVGAALDQVEGAREWGVKVYCDRSALSAWAIGELPQLRQLASTVSAASPGARYMLEKRLQRAAQQAVDDLRHKKVEAIGQRLAVAARAAQASALQPQQIHGHAEEMALNGAYLVAETELARFRAALDDLVAEYCPCGFSFELTGPWPVYSFSTLGHEEVA